MYEAFIALVLDSFFQAIFKKLTLTEFWHIIKERYAQLSEKLLKYFSLSNCISVSLPKNILKAEAKMYLLLSQTLDLQKCKTSSLL